MFSEFGNFGQGKAIALVEDDVEMLSMLADFLSHAGYEVHCYESANEFMEVAESTKNYFSLVISDMHMRNGDGLDLLRHLRQKGIKVPVLLMTAAPSVLDERIAAALGAIAYLKKPFPLQDLLAQVRASASLVVA